MHDNLAEKQLAKHSVPVMKVIDGKACWLKFGTTEYVHEPELEAIWRAAQRPTGKVIQLSFWEIAA